jgi:hypothetical protein
MGLPIYNLEDWVIARNYYAFISVIQGKGVPDVVSFDHDLADVHYKIQDFNYEDPDYEKTGYHCAKWLIDYCLDNEEELPKRVIVHSMNPYGSRNIKSLFDTFYKVFNKEPQDIPMNPRFK